MISTQVATPLGATLRDAQALHDRLRAARARVPTRSLGDRLQDYAVAGHDAVHAVAVDSLRAVVAAAAYGLAHPVSAFSGAVLALVVALVYLTA